MRRFVEGNFSERFFNFLLFCVIEIEKKIEWSESTFSFFFFFFYFSAFLFNFWDAFACELGIDWQVEVL